MHARATFCAGTVGGVVAGRVDEEKGGGHDEHEEGADQGGDTVADVGVGELGCGGDPVFGLAEGDEEL